MRIAKMNFAVADSHRSAEKRFATRAGEKLTAFVELELVLQPRKCQSRLY